MRNFAPFVCLAATALCGCVEIKSDFRPEIQRDPPPGQLYAPKLSVLAMTDPKAAFQFQGDIDTVLSSAAWRWTGRNPAVRLLVPKSLPVRLTIEATLPEAVFKETGPMGAEVTLNGRPLGRMDFPTPSKQQFAAAVPDGWIAPGESAEAAMLLDKGMTDTNTHRFYGLQLARIGLER